MDLEDVRLAVYQRFALQGTVGPIASLAEELDADQPAVGDAIRRLADQRHLVLGESGEVAMAHPFSATPLGVALMGSRTLWWGGCAWDSFALPHLVGDWMPDLLIDQESVLVSTRCPACGQAHAWNVDRHSPPHGEQMAHFLVPADRMWDDVVHTCAHQRIFCSSGCVDRWLDATGNSRGEEMNLDTLWRLGAHWYQGRLERGYQRREPATAGEYLRGIGLNGAFWGVE